MEFIGAKWLEDCISALLPSLPLCSSYWHNSGETCWTQISSLSISVTTQRYIYLPSYMWQNLAEMLELLQTSSKPVGTSSEFPHGIFADLVGQDTWELSRLLQWSGQQALIIGMNKIILDLKTGCLRRNFAIIVSQLSLKLRILSIFICYPSTADTCLFTFRNIIQHTVMLPSGCDLRLEAGGL